MSHVRIFRSWSSDSTVQTKKSIRALIVFNQLPQETKVLWNDGPRLRAVDQDLRDAKLSPDQMGKGRNVWFCMGYALGSNQADALAIHDCDIVTYDRALLARLLYPVAHPQFNYEFCKGYYTRVSNGKMNGRVAGFGDTLVANA